MTQLAIRDNQQLAPSASEFGVMKEQAEMLIKSKFLSPSIQSPEQAIAIILTGRELGIGTMAALNNITVIQQKPTVSPQLMLALIGRSGQLEDIRFVNKHSPDGRVLYVSCSMKRKGRTEHTEVFGTAEAMSLRLLDKDNYKKQPGTMFKWRAVAACARVVFPGVILGLYTPEEMGADVEVTDTEEMTAMPPVEKQTSTVIKMPQPKSVEQETIAAEPVFETPKTDYTDEWNQALENPVKKDKAVSPATKGKLLLEGGYVKQTAKGFEVVDPDGGEVGEVTRTNGKVLCTCEDFTEGRKHNDVYRCACIEAVKLFLVKKQEPQAA